MSTMRIFVSHSHEDDAFCRALVQGLRRAGADVWYDEHNLGSGQLMTVIQRELGSRPVFVVILTKATFASRWVRRETLWAYELGDRDPSRIILPVTAGPIARSDFSAENEWLFLHDFKRIEAPGYQPYPQAEAVTRTLHALQLTLPGEAPLPTGPLPADSVADLIGRGRALNAQTKYAEALPLFQRALERDPRAFDAWLTAGYTLGNLGRYEEALVALDRALALSPNSARAWSNKGAALNGLRRYEEELAAYDRALALDPQYAKAWSNKGYALLNLKRYSEALAAYDRALALDPNEADAWSNTGLALLSLNRPREALVAFDRALALDPDDAVAVSGKRSVFHERGRNGRQATQQVRERATTGRLGVLQLRLRQQPLLMSATLLLTLVLVGLLGIPVYIGLQRVGQLTPTTTPHATPVPKHEPTPAVAAGFTGFENASFSLAYPSDWTHTHHDDALNARNILHSEDYKGAGNNEVLVGTTASVPGDQLQAFLGDVAQHQFSQWTLQGLAVNRHITYDHEQWLEDDYAVAVLQGKSNVTLEAHVLVANHGTLTYYLIVIDTRSSFASDAGKYSTPMLASFRFQG